MSSIVNFAIPETLDRRVKEVVRKKGFASRAELFRVAVIDYLENLERLPLDNNPEIMALSDRLEQELKRKVNFNKLPSIKKQLERLKDL